MNVPAGLNAPQPIPAGGPAPRLIPDVRTGAAPFPSTRTDDDFEDSPNVYGDWEEDNERIGLDE